MPFGFVGRTNAQDKDEVSILHLLTAGFNKVMVCSRV